MIKWPILCKLSVVSVSCVLRPFLIGLYVRLLWHCRYYRVCVFRKTIVTLVLEIFICILHLLYPVVVLLMCLCLGQASGCLSWTLYVTLPFWCCDKSAAVNLYFYHCKSEYKIFSLHPKTIFGALSPWFGGDIISNMSLHGWNCGNQ